MTPAIQATDAVELYLRTHICPATKSAYGRALGVYGAWLAAQSLGLNIDLDTAISYRDHLLSQYAESSAAQHISAIKAFYKVVKELGLIELNVWSIVKAPAAHNETASTKAVIEAELIAIYAAATTSGPRDLLIVRLLYEVGMRRQEVAQLTKPQLQMTNDGPAIRITGKGRKTALVGITPELHSAISEWAYTHHNPYVFPGRGVCRPISERQVNNILEAFGVRPHQLRHTHVTNALGQGHSIQDVSRSVRHSSISTTMRYYSSRDQVNNSSARIITSPAQRTLNV